MENENCTRKYLDEVFILFEEKLKEYIALNGTVVSYKAGKWLPSLEFPHHHVLLMAQGTLKIMRKQEDDNDFYAYMVTAGEACTISMFCDIQNIKVRTLTDVVMIKFPVSLMSIMMRQYDTWNEFVLSTCSARITNLMDLSALIARKRMYERLGLYLKEFSNKLGITRLNLTHKEIAEDLSTSREVVSRLLKKMEADGKVKNYRYSVELISG